MNHKNELTTYSENFSIYSSLLMTLISYVPIHQNKIYKLNIIINIIKSLNFINCSYSEILHHIFSLFTSIIIFNSRNINDESILYELNLGIRTNFSTIFLILMYRNYNNHIYKLLFAITFFYYRIQFVYMILKGVKGVEYICINNIVNYDFCFNYFKLCYILLSCLNVYWMYLIILKLNRLYLKSKSI